MLTTLATVAARHLSENATRVIIAAISAAGTVAVALIANGHSYLPEREKPNEEPRQR